jgi:hypothetical protein
MIDKFFFTKLVIFLLIVGVTAYFFKIRERRQNKAKKPNFFQRMIIDLDKKRPGWIFLFIGIVWIFGASFSLLTKSWGDFLVQMGLFLVFFFLYFYVKKEKMRADVFMDWLMEQVPFLMDGKEIFYKTQKISLETKIVYVSYAVSFFFFTYVGDVGWMVKSIKTFPKRFFYTILTILFGVWAFPWGPVTVLDVLIHNWDRNVLTIKEWILMSERKE